MTHISIPRIEQEHAMQFGFAKHVASSLTAMNPAFLPKCSADGSQMRKTGLEEKLVEATSLQP